jgi:hypothetical protein
MAKRKLEAKPCEECKWSGSFQGMLDTYEICKCPIRDYPLARFNREPGMKCGPSGKLWEKKEMNNTFKYELGICVKLIGGFGHFIVTSRGWLEEIGGCVHEVYGVANAGTNRIIPEHLIESVVALNP